ncbi:SPRY-domain-containing protein [Basidiobolus meristosporus CBS 931.73]|uniref:SPRY-domain-containing protein n=1 Tax=Basidiobolus meristosporus CBS 931.73 TaxID=1314790 RepID=A0A1Y1Z5A5_9FUNG|nr:SPRY-domain-containing protein [Basidiobolus meristosporus CBS 931.73]|eukprot:ORY05429.1 SPRY-domain-containing protein [Basidiobolus meristosporus CBS 931.73]
MTNSTGTSSRRATSQSLGFSFGSSRSASSISAPIRPSISGSPAVTSTKNPAVRPKIPKYLEDTAYAEVLDAAYCDPSVDPNQVDLPNLPTSWNGKDKCSLLELSADGLRVNYIGTGKSDNDAAAVRSNHAMPPQCGIFYFEVEIISKGRDGYIGIGFSTHGVSLSRLPGWDPNSWGYHGDDGHSFCCSGTGKPYGPTYTTGDIIGCCVNFRDGSAFYTKNGVFLGIAFRDLKGTLYPSVGFRTPGEQVEVNFGQRRFKFDIEHYMKEEKTKLWDMINATPTPPISQSAQMISQHNISSENNLPSILNELILSYMVHHGYSETAKTFAKDIMGSQDNYDSVMGNSLSNSETDVRNRQKIRGYILDGDIDSAIKLCDECYPDVLKNNEPILFRLRCRKFIEMMRKTVVNSNGNHGEEEDEDTMDVDDAKSEVRGRKRRLNPETDLNALLEAMKYGQQLQADYKDDEREDVKKTLVETFSLLAYPNPEDSVVAHLLDSACREPVANTLNSAILVSQNRPPIPPLEQTFRQTCVVVKDLVKQGVGNSAFVNVHKDCLL